MTENPFQFGRELGADELVNRSEELALLRDVITTASKLFIIGPRRFGKSSLLKAASERAKREGHIVIRIDAEPFASIDQMARKIVEESAGALKGPIEKVSEMTRTYFKSLRPELDVKVSEKEWKASFGVTPSGDTGEVALLVDALNGLENLAKDLYPKKRVALIIDEFQEVIILGGKKAEKQIRSAIQTHKHTAYIFAGSKTSMLIEMVMDASRPFYRLGQNLAIKELPRPEFARFLLDKFILGDFFRQSADNSVRRGLVNRILDAAEDVPANAQMLAHALWNRLTVMQIGAPEKAFLSSKFIDETFDRLVRQNDTVYTEIWSGLTAAQRRALTATAQEGGRGLLSKRVTEAANLSQSSMQKSLKALLSRSILRQDESVGNVRLRFEDPFFAQWIRLFAS